MKAVMVCIILASLRWGGESGGGVDPRHVAPYGPVGVTPLKDQGAPKTIERIAQQCADRALGSFGLTGTLVLFSDRSPFGEQSSSQAMLFSDVTMRVGNGAAQDTVQVSALVDAKDGSLLAVYTTPKSTWIAPIGTERDPEAEADKYGWNVKAASTDSVSLTAEGVLSAIWRALGIRPSEPGQIIMRPRHATTRVPAVDREGKKVDPPNPEGMAWVVQVLGVYREETPTFYWSGFLVLVDDRSGEVIKGLYMP
jgi:hypothetical protein